MTEQTMMEAIGQARVARGDDWSNEVLGIGGSKDPSVYTTYGSRGMGISDGVLEALYVEEHFAAKVIECVVKHGMRKGWDLVVPGEDAKKAGEIRGAYEAEERRLGVAIEMYQGACWGRLFGGAVTWVGADDKRDPELPLDEEEIDRVVFLHTFDRRDVIVHTRYADPEHPKFQEPETYRITPRVIGAISSLAGFGGSTIVLGGAIVHESRLVVWPGEATTDQRRLERNGWDDSVLERCWAALKQTGEDYAGKSLLLNRISQTVIKIKGFAGIVAAKVTEFKLRLGLISAARSRSNMIPIDTEESIENVTQPIGGVPELVDRSVERLAIAADIPLTVFVGRPPTGASGDAELETWNTNVESWQSAVLAPRHARIVELLLRAKKGPTSGKLPDVWSVRYRSLRTPKPKEEAELRKLQAETDAIEIDKAIITPEDVAIGRHTLTGDPRILLGDDTIKAKVARRELLDGQPPKDNAELGTVGARSAAAMDVVSKVAARQVPRETGIEILTQFFRLTEEQAKKMLGPETFVPASAEPPKPGPAPEPKKGEGAGAPPPLPGFDDGGDPKSKTLPAEGGA